MIVASAVLCLAANVYYEARSEMIPGQYAVALVTMNRAGDASRVCSEVFRRKQFSWTNRGVARAGQGWRIPKPRDEQAWELAVKIARYTLSGRMPDLTFGATHYHTIDVRPEWRVSMVRIKRMGRHVFYS